MGRLRLYTSDQILDGARGLVLGEGIAAATISNIARASGAPPGSIYYRFDSRETLLAELWIRAAYGRSGTAWPQSKPPATRPKR
jgi:AcrR family transcriptional regulator